MRKLLYLLSLVSFGACNTFDVPNDNTPVDVVNKTMDQLEVPVNFTFKTSQDVNVTITTSDNAGQKLKNVPFKLYAVEKNSTDSVLVLENYTNTEGVFQTKINITKNIDRFVVLTSYVGLPEYSTMQVKSEDVSINLGVDNTRRDGLVSSDKFTGSGGGGTSVDAVFEYMGKVNSLGVPNYLLAKGDAVSNDLLEMINASLPEARPVPLFNPSYISPSTRTSVSLKDSAAVWVTFVHEGAGYRNALGYYTYPTNKPPKTAADIAKLKVVFPNVSYLNSGGGLKTGDKVLLGNFPAGTTIAWFLVPDGWEQSDRSVVERPLMPTRYSDRNLNTYTLESFRSHVALLADSKRELLLLGFEDLNRPSGDNDFNDAVFYVTANPFTAVETNNMANTTNYATDTDNDGVPDAQDIAPNDPSYAFKSYTPAVDKFGTLAFEDAFPFKGDYDMNDMIVDYNFEERSNAANKVTAIKATLVLKAMGASFRSGFGIEVPVAPSKVASATGMKNKGGLVKLSANGTEEGQSKAVFIAFDNAFSLMSGATSGSFVNTEKDKPLVNYDTIRLNITFNEPIEKATLGTAPYNPFIFINQERGREVHLPGKMPTALANPTYFKTGDDDSGNGKYYQTKRALPWAINVVEMFEYPVEKVPINAAFLKFNQWVESNGTLYIDWYKNKSSYRTTEKIY